MKSKNKCIDKKKDKSRWKLLNSVYEKCENDQNLKNKKDMREKNYRQKHTEINALFIIEYKEFQL